jgi:hypothetical protein
MDKGNEEPTLFVYRDLKSEAIPVTAQSINAYLIDGPQILVHQRRDVLGEGLPQVSMGSMPRDGGFLLINSRAEYDQVLEDKIAAKYLNRFIMGDELINDIERWCLWLTELDPQDVSKSKELKQRLASVAKFRRDSRAPSTQKMADTPHLFGQRSQPDTDYLGIPSVFSENREWATVERFKRDVIAGNKIYKCDDPDGFVFSITSSSMFITWQKSIGGRLESRCNFSNTLVWNNFPLPKMNESLRKQIIEAGQEITRVRRTFKGVSLADLYNPLMMDSELRKCHKKLDRFVDSAFGLKGEERTNSEREKRLFEKYLELTSEGTI